MFDQYYYLFFPFLLPVIAQMSNTLDDIYECGHSLRA